MFGKAVNLWADIQKQTPHVLGGITPKQTQTVGKNVYMLIICILMIRDLTIMRTYDYEKSIGFLVNKSAKAFQKAFDQELRMNVGLTISQWRIIFTLIRQSGLTQREIADRVGVEAPTLIPIIDKMEKEGLVERKTYQ